MIFKDELEDVIRFLKLIQLVLNIAIKMKTDRMEY